MSSSHLHHHDARRPHSPLAQHRPQPQPERCSLRPSAVVHLGHLDDADHFIPRAGLDPIDSAESALAVIGLATGLPCSSETVVVLLDAERRGLGIVVVHGTVDTEAVQEIAEFIAATPAADRRCDAVIIASCRPGHPYELDDAERWLELDHTFTMNDVELVEWFVIDAERVSCPRDLVGAPSRWTQQPQPAPRAEPWR